MPRCVAVHLQNNHSEVAPELQARARAVLSAMALSLPHPCLDSFRQLQLGSLILQCVFLTQLPGSKRESRTARQMCGDIKRMGSGEPLLSHKPPHFRKLIFPEVKLSIYSAKILLGGKVGGLSAPQKHLRASPVLSSFSSGLRHPLMVSALCFPRHPGQTETEELLL